MEEQDMDAEAQLRYESMLQMEADEHDRIQLELALRASLADEAPQHAPPPPMPAGAGARAALHPPNARAAVLEVEAQAFRLWGRPPPAPAPPPPPPVRPPAPAERPAARDAAAAAAAARQPPPAPPPVYAPPPVERSRGPSNAALATALHSDRALRLAQDEAAEASRLADLAREAAAREAVAAETRRVAAMGTALALALQLSRAGAAHPAEAGEQRVSFPSTRLADASFRFGPACPCASLYAAARAELLQAALADGNREDAAMHALAEACVAGGIQLRSPAPGSEALPDGPATLAEVGYGGRVRLVATVRV